MMNTLANEARIILESAALALEINHPDIEAIRDMLKQADALLESQLSYGPPQVEDDEGT